MPSHSLPTDKEKLDKVIAWAKAGGGETRATTNPYEVVRIAFPTGHLILYRNDRGRGARWWCSEGPHVLAQLAKNYSEAKGLPDVLRAVRQKPALPRERMILTVAARDGWECFYCGCVLCPPSDKAEGAIPATIEHVVPTSRGGPNNAANIVLSCAPCNGEAGNMTVAEKVLLRERVRAKGTKT